MMIGDAMTPLTPPFDPPFDPEFVVMVFDVPVFDVICLYLADLLLLFQIFPNRHLKASKNDKLEKKISALQK